MIMEKTPSEQYMRELLAKYQGNSYETSKIGNVVDDRDLKSIEAYLHQYFRRDEVILKIPKEGMTREGVTMGEPVRISPGEQQIESIPQDIINSLIAVYNKLTHNKGLLHLAEDEIKGKTELGEKILSTVAKDLINLGAANISFDFSVNLAVLGAGISITFDLQKIAGMGKN